jgi:hypothetical protein
MVLDKIQFRGFYNLSFKAYLFLENRLLRVKKTYRVYNKKRKDYQLDAIIAAYDRLFAVLDFCYSSMQKKSFFLN